MKTLSSRNEYVCYSDCSRVSYNLHEELRLNFSISFSSKLYFEGDKSAKDQTEGDKGEHPRGVAEAQANTGLVIMRSNFIFDLYHDVSPFLTGFVFHFDV